MMAQPHPFISDAHMESLVHQAEEKQFLSILTDQCTFTAQFDSDEGPKLKPRCAQSTRENILKKLRDWVESPTPTTCPDPTIPTSDNLTASCFWLHGGTGSGKTAIAQSLAEQLNDTGNLAASFFFFSIETSRNDGNKLFPTIIYQLTTTNNAYKKKVIEQLRGHQDIFHKYLDQQVKVLLTDPLSALHAEGVDLSAFPRLIVIDGLDECKYTDMQYNILTVIAQTILSGVPYPFRFLITSRPEGHISRTFEFNKYIKQIPLQKYDLSKDPDASKDIRTFLQQEFIRLRENHEQGSNLESNGWPSENELVTLVDRSSGHFVYPASVIRFIRLPQYPPDYSLKIALGLTPQGPKDCPFPQLDCQYLITLFDVEGDSLMNIKRAFSILYLISEKVGYFSIHHSGSNRVIEDMLLLRPGDLDLMFDPLRCLVAQDRGEVDTYVLHKTLFDFLLDPERSGLFSLSKQLYHESAALYMHNANVLSDWFYAPDFMYFAYHCYLAQPIQDESLIRFIKNLDMLYTDHSSTPNKPLNTNTSQVHYQTERPLLAMFVNEGEQAAGAKTIFYILRMLSLLSGFRGQDLHEIHCTKITQFYSGVKVPPADVNQLNQAGSSASMSVGGNDELDPQDALDEMIRAKLKSWQPAEYILRAITAANSGSNSTAARDTLISREHAVFESFARTQHLSNSDYRLQSMLLGLSSEHHQVTHSYHTFSVEHGNSPSLVLVVGTYSRGGTGGVGAVINDPTGIRDVGAGPGAVCSARGFNINRLGQKKLKEWVSKFLDDHLMKVERELPQAINDRFDSKFKF